MRLEIPRKHITLASFRASRYAGRAWGERLMRKFFLSDIALITALRYLSWLGPCPEFSCLLLDWSRWNQPTKAGGLPAALLPIIEHISKGNLFAAKKLAFAQQLISGVPDSGAWGGEALSDTEVRVKARNRECCRVLKGFLDEHEECARKRSLAPTPKSPELASSDGKTSFSHQGEGRGDEIKVAILYGAYHIGDLSAKLKAMGLKSESASSLTAWTMDCPSNERAPHHTSRSRTQIRKSRQGSVEIEGNLFGLRSVVQVLSRVKSPALSIAVAGICTTYLVLGALDWWLLIDFLVEVGKSISSTVNTERSSSALNGMLLQLLMGDSDTLLTDDGKIFEASLAVLYSVAYVQRHLWALRTASSVGVQWDRGLFEDSLDN